MILTDRRTETVPRNLAHYWSGLLLLGCGLDPLFEANPDDPDQYGVDIKGTAYSIDLREVQVLYPTDLNQLMFRANVSHLLLGVPEQGVSTFRTFAAASGPGGQQDVCASTTELALALWNGPGEFVIEGGRFFLPIGGTDVRFDSTRIDATISDSGDWSPMTMQALIDTREIADALQQDDDICGSIPGGCNPCDDGLRLCIDVDMDMTATLSDIDFDPQPECGQP